MEITKAKVVDVRGRKIPKAPPNDNKIVQYSVRHLAKTKKRAIVVNG